MTNKFKLFLTLLFVAILSCGEMWGADETLTLDGDAVTWGSGSGYQTGTGNATTNASTSIALSWNRAYKNNGGIQMEKNNGEVHSTSHPVTNSQIKSITVTNGTNSATLYGSTDGETWISITYTSGSAVDVSDKNYKYFKAAAIGSYCVMTSVVVVYTQPKYTITYQANGASTGTVPTDNTKYDPSASVTVKGNTGNLERTGCTFAGWNTKADGTGTNYAADATFSISANTTLYAKWTATVTWKANNVTVKTDNIVVPAAGKEVALPTAEQIGDNKCGDKVMGWTETENHKANTAPADMIDSAPTVTGNKTYYAVFADYAE